VNSRSDVFTATGIIANAGTKLKIAATGTWNTGAGSVGPDGGANVPAECPVSQPAGSGWQCQRIGALIGRWGTPSDPLAVGAGNPMLIGSQQVVTAEGAELLFAINDNLGPCDGSNRGSCYDDNSGSLTVTISTQ